MLCDVPMGERSDSTEVWQEYQHGAISPGGAGKSAVTYLRDREKRRARDGGDGTQWLHTKQPRPTNQISAYCSQISKLQVLIPFPQIFLHGPVVGWITPSPFFDPYGLGHKVTLAPPEMFFMFSSNVAPKCPQRESPSGSSWRCGSPTTISARSSFSNFLWA